MPVLEPRFNLTELNFLEIDTQTILDDLIARYEKIAGRTLAAGDPIRLFINTIAQQEIQLRNAFNLAARNNLLSYASGEYLDHLGEYVNTPRLQASKATTKVRFTLNETQDSTYIVPANTLITNGLFNFATDTVALIEVGQLTVDIPCTATDGGADRNNVAIGAINQLVDPLPAIAKIENLEITSGGSDIEDDESYAERIRLAPASFSVAGPHDSYEYHAKSYSSAITDVQVYGLETEPGNVYVLPLLSGGTIPEQSFLDGLYGYLSADNIRPLTDNLLVQAPVAESYKIDFVWYLADDNLNQVTQITKAVSSAVEKYRLWQQSKIGRDINPDVLIEYLRQAGAKRVEITAPKFTVLEQSQVAQCNIDDINVTFGGSESA